MVDLSSLLTWCDDLHQVRGNVSQLQATLNQILAKAPSVSQYQELTKAFGDLAGSEATSLPLHEKLRTSLNSPQLKVAVRLKSLFDKGLLPFLLGMTRINFKSPKCDRYVGYLLDYVPPKQDAANVSIDVKQVTVKPNTDDTELYPPLLPPIENKGLLRLVLTDKSLRQPSDYLELTQENGRVNFNSSHNRKLSLRGKYLLDSALMDIIDEALPDAHEDDLEFLRHKLTSAHILAKFAYVYNLPEALVHQISKETKASDKLTIFKNVFLAYVGGLYQDNYSQVQIYKWLRALFRPILTSIEAESTYNKQLKSREFVAWAEFQFLVSRLSNYFLRSVKKIPYHFVTLEEEPSTCRLELGRLQLGTGTGDNILTARRRAVLETMSYQNLREQLLLYIIEQNQSSSVSLSDDTSSLNTSNTNASVPNSIPKDVNETVFAEPEPRDIDEQNGSKQENPHSGSKKLAPQVNLAKAPLAPQNQPRMPLQYGMLPLPMPKGPRGKGI